MTTDIVDRLRALRGPWIGDGINPAINAYEVADEIERLRTRLEIDPGHQYDGIATRDVTIKLLELEAAKQRARERELCRICAEAYQVVGSMLSDIGRFGTGVGTKILDNLSQQKLVHDDVLPWPSFSSAPITPQRAVQSMADAGLSWFQKKPAEPWNGRCKPCGGEMKPGRAIAETLTGVPDFPDGEVCTVSAGGPGRLIDCLKCSACGWSVTIPEPTKTASGLQPERSDRMDKL